MATKKAAATRKDRLDPKTLASQYGYVTALINSNSELKALFAKAYGTATSGQWTAQKFQAALQNTKWFKTHSDQWRKVETLRLADPATYNASVKAATADVTRLAAQMGAVITPAQAANLGKVFYTGAYNTSQQQEALSTYITAYGGTTAQSGTAAATQRTLAAYAGDMGIKLSNDYFTSADRSVAAGLSTADHWMADIQAQAKSKYVAFADRIDQGATVKDLASAYTNQMATTLELDPNSINLEDPTIQKALTGVVDQKTGMPQVQSLWGFDQGLKQDPRWQYTKNANQQANQTAMNVLQAMGFQG